MRKFILKTLLFSIPILAYCFLAYFFIQSILSLNNGPSNKDQIEYSFENALKKEYQLLILGNSRMYRGIAPEKFTQKTFNFSHNNDSYNQLYFKLKYLNNKKKKFTHLILGVDYFMFSFKTDTRNFVYGDIFGEEYLKDFSSRLWRLKLEHYLYIINPRMLLSLLHFNKTKPYLKETGQYIYPGKAREKDKVHRKIDRLPFQENYFKKILNLCENNNIKVYMVMMPIRQNELKCYNKKDINSFNTFINSFTKAKKVYFLNYTHNQNYDINDYSDITHLNESGAIKFSEMLNQDLKLLP